MAPTKREHLRSKIQALCANNIPIKEIARRLNVSRNTVKKWRNSPDGSVTDQPRSGRPSKLTPNTKLKIKNMAREQVGVGIRTVCKKLNFSDNFTEREKRIGVSTVRRYVKTTASGKAAYRERVKPLLSQKNIDDRVRFCERMVNESYASEEPGGRIQRAHILFTDESPIELHPKFNRQNRRIRTDDPKKIPQVFVPEFTLKIMVESGISRYGKTALLIVDQGKTVDGEYYPSNILLTYVNALKNAAQSPRP